MSDTKTKGMRRVYLWPSWRDIVRWIVAAATPTPAWKCGECGWVQTWDGGCAECEWAREDALTGGDGT
jgi:hypothetical protein